MSDLRSAREKAIMDRAFARGEALYREILPRLPVGSPDPYSSAYALWVNLTHLLAEGGWTPEELARDAQHHATLAGCAGTA